MRKAKSVIREALERMVARNRLPRDVSCPHCEAQVNFGCHSPSHYGARTHSARWKAIGIVKPNYDQTHADYLDGIERNGKIRQ